MHRVSASAAYVILGLNRVEVESLELLQSKGIAATVSRVRRLPARFGLSQGPFLRNSCSLHHRLSDRLLVVLHVRLRLIVILRSLVLMLHVVEVHYFNFNL